MDPSIPSGQLGPNGRRLHIAHRRSPSELTPLMLEQLALAQSSEYNQIPQGYVNLGMMPGQQQMPGYGMPQMQGHMGHGQYPQGMPQQHLNVPMGPPQQSAHRRNQSSVSAAGSMGPPPPPGRENQAPRGGRGGAPPGAGHARRHSLALPEAKKAAEAAEQKRKNAQFQFPGPGAEAEQSSGYQEGSLAPPGQGHAGGGRGRGGSHGRSQSMAVGNARGGGNGGRGFQFPDNNQQQQGGDYNRRGSAHGHARSGSRNFDQNWRQPANADQQQQPQQPQHAPMGSFAANAPSFQPGHRARGSMSQQSVGSIGNFQYPGQGQQILFPQQHMLVPNIIQPGQPLSAAQIAQLQVMGINGMGLSQHAPQMGGNQQQQQRKTLFTPYLPQASLPALLQADQLVAGILRVNKKNRSDAYVTTTILDADIFICGSKDRNRALEGDLVAIELLDVDEVWSQKREKEEKKKRKDGSDGRGSTIAVNDATTQPESSNEPGIRRRGSLRQRPTQKKNDDVEVEGQSLLLMEEEEINDEQKPLYAGHVVAVIERIAGQMFSGTLGLLRPSSQATKEKQEAERAAREGPNSRHHDRPIERPKIVWFKPTDKRVPLIAIPTEQAPKDFVERHQDYANKIFVACIKRWPITSLHPFGTLVETLGEMGDLKVETDALLRDNNFGPDEFTDAVIRATGFEEWSVSSEGEAVKQRRDFRDAPVLTFSPQGVKELDNAVHFRELPDGSSEIAFHVADVSHFVKHGSLVDREARKRGTAVYLTNRTVPLLPSRLAHQILCLQPGEERYAISIVFKLMPNGRIDESATWIGKSVIKSTGLLAWADIDAVVRKRETSLSADVTENVSKLNAVVQKWRAARYGDRSQDLHPLRLVYQLDDENVPPEDNIFNKSPAHDLYEELCCKANEAVAKKLHAELPDKAVLRRQSSPNARRLATFTERLTAIGFDIDTTSSGTLMNSVFKIKDEDLRKGVETLLIKTMQRAKYFIAGRGDSAHYAFNVPVYTHFTSPSRRYVDVLAHRQLDSLLGGPEFTEDVDNLSKIMEMCNTKKESAHFAQEQSVHIEACRMMDRKAQEIGGDLIAEGIVICVYESAFDVLIPEWGFEKRVHCDQLPLKKAEFDKHKRLLELYWEKGVPSSAYIPEDEQPKHNGRSSESAQQRAREQEEAKRRQMDTNTMGTDEVDALFDEDDDSEANGVSLTTQSMPPSPTRGSLSLPHRTKSDSKLSQQAGGDNPETKLTNKEKYLSMFSLREENGDHIQDVREMSRVPIILKTDLSKSPPCLTIRSVNPYAL